MPVDPLPPVLTTKNVSRPCQMFPGGHSRSARQALIYDLRPGLLLSDLGRLHVFQNGSIHATEETHL